MYPDDLPRRERAAILSEQQGHRCCYCGVRFADEMPADLRLYYDPRLTVEHVRRLADGGERTWWNEVAACRGCNSARGEVHPDEFYQIVHKASIDEVRRALRSSRSPKRRSAETLGSPYRKVNKRLGKGWPVSLGEVAMTPDRQAYFEAVYGPWYGPTSTATDRTLPVSKRAAKDDRFVEINGMKVLRWNVRQVG